MCDKLLSRNDCNTWFFLPHFCRIWIKLSNSTDLRSSLTFCWTWYGSKLFAQAFPMVDKSATSVQRVYKSLVWTGIAHGIDPDLMPHWPGNDLSRSNPYSARKEFIYLLQTVKTQIRGLLEEPSDQGIHCLSKFLIFARKTLICQNEVVKIQNWNIPLINSALQGLN